MSFTGEQNILRKYSAIIFGIQASGQKVCLSQPSVPAQIATISASSDSFLRLTGNLSPNVVFPFLV